VLPNGRLRLTSGVDPGFGARVVREFSFESTGDFVIAQTVEKVRGAPVLLSIWSVTQINPPEAVFLPLNANSIYKNNFHWINPPRSDNIATIISPTLLQMRPAPAGSYKIGVDSPVAAIAAVKGDTIFRQRAARPQGDYPDGALGHGFPIELYNSGVESAQYMELELLSPLRIFRIGSHWRHTVRWSLHSMPSVEVGWPIGRTTIESLLLTKPG
jgi:hypothetical protein